MRRLRLPLAALFLAGYGAGCSEAKPSAAPDAPAGAGAGGVASVTAGGSGTSTGGKATLPQAGSAALAGSTGEPAATGGSSGAGSSGSTGSAGSAGVGASAGASTGGASAEPAVTKDGELKLMGAGLSVVSYGGYLNGESFQQEGILSHKGYQYTAFWNTARHVVMARRQLPDGAWATFEFTDYTNSESDAHNVITLGVTAADGTLHVAFDHHDSPLHYRKSHEGLVSDPDSASWAATSFEATTGSLVDGAKVTGLTYPRFISEPGGAKTLFSARLGSSGSGDEYLWEYSADSHAWTSLGKYIDGISDNINAYLHGLSYGRGDKNGKRLHAAWCWRDTSNASTNHDLLYVYSDDDGRTWHNDAGASVGTTGTTAVHASSSGIKVWSIGQNRGLINQEHMVTDAGGRVHVLLSHLPDGVADNSDFDSARGKSQYFHYWRDETGKWTKGALSLPVVAASRGKLAVASSGNLYAVLPDLRIAGASLSSGFKTWTLLERSDDKRFFSDPLIDSARLLSEDKLSVVYQKKASPDVYVLDYTLE